MGRVTDSDKNTTTIIRKVTVKDKVEEKPEVPGEIPVVPSEKPQVVLPEGTPGDTNFSDKLPQTGRNSAIVSVVIGMLMDIGRAFICAGKKK